MLETGVSPSVLFAVSIGVILAVGGFIAGIRLRFLSTEAPLGMAAAGFVLGILFAPAMAVAALVLLLLTGVWLFFRQRHFISGKIDRYVDRVAALTGHRLKSRPYEELIAEAEAEHQRRRRTLLGADYNKELRRTLLGAENERHKKKLTKLTEEHYHQA